MKRILALFISSLVVLGMIGTAGALTVNNKESMWTGTTGGAGTSASEAFLSVGMNFDGGPSLPTPFEIDAIPNALGSIGSDDTIFLPPPPLSEIFDIGSVLYLFGLLGFGDAPSALVSSFSSAEGFSNSTQLWDRITQGTNPVPEPATMVLVGISLVGIMGIRFKKKK